MRVCQHLSAVSRVDRERARVRFIFTLTCGDDDGLGAAVAGSPALELVELALKATVAYNRPDLTSRLQHTRRRLQDPDVRVLVVGEFKQGKSQLINALVNASVCPVDDDISTAVITVVKYSPTDKASVTIVRESDPATGEQRQQRINAAIEDLAKYVSEAGNPGNREGLSYVEVHLPRRILSSGLALVDTPGVGGLGSAHGALTMGALPSADAVLLVSDAAQEYTAPELDFLSAAMRLCPNIACILTKTDLYPQWRRIAELNRGHLASAGLVADLLPTSSVLRLHAVRTNDAALNEESGFKALVAYLRDRVVSQSDLLDRRSASQDVLAVTEQLAHSMRSELEAQEDPERAEALIAELTRAKERADALKKRTSRWQLTLNDGFADLQSDIDYDLRDRMRTITKDAEDQIDAEDPLQIWDQFSDWVHQQVAAAAAANFVWASQRARYLATQVADHFVEGGQQVVPDLRGFEADGMGGKVNPMVRPDMEKFGFGQKLFTGMKGGYGGMLMIGMATSVAGLAMLNPISAAAGLLFGGKGIREEKQRMLQKRRADAKSAVRRHIDDVSFQVGKDSRDMLRHVQRTLRDHFTTIAEEVTTSMAESVKAAQAAVTTVTSDREKRVRDLKAELDRIAAVEQRAKALVSQ